MDKHGISNPDAKRQNRMRILRTIRTKGMISRMDIAEELELTRATITMITNEMIEQGLLREVGEVHPMNEHSHKGRRKVLLAIKPNYKFAIGLSIEEKVINMGLSTLFGEVLEKASVKITKTMTFNKIAEMIADNCEIMMANSCLERENVIGIGVGIMPEIIERYGFVKLNTRPDYQKLSAELKKATGFPIICGNTIEMMAMANIDFDRSTGRYDYTQCFITADKKYHLALSRDTYTTDISVTDKINNFIVGGINGLGGAIKTELTTENLRKSIKKMFSQENTPVLYKETKGNINNVTFENVSRAIKDGDTVLVGIYENWLDKMVVLLNNIHCILVTDKIVLHGFEIGYVQLEEIRDMLGKLSVYDNTPCVKLSLTDGKLSFLGGCAIVIRDFLYNRGGYQQKSNIPKSSQTEEFTEETTDVTAEITESEQESEIAEAPTEDITQEPGQQNV